MIWLIFQASLLSLLTSRVSTKCSFIVHWRCRPRQFLLLFLCSWSCLSSCSHITSTFLSPHILLCIMRDDTSSSLFAALFLFCCRALSLLCSCRIIFISSTQCFSSLLGDKLAKSDAIKLNSEALLFFLTRLFNGTNSDTYLAWCFCLLILSSIDPAMDGQRIEWPSSCAFCV